MIITAQFYYSLLGIIILLSAILVGIVISFFVMLRRLSSYETRENKIIEAAQKKAEGIISQATNIHDSSAADLEAAVQELQKHEEEELSEKSGESRKLLESKIEEINSNNIQAFAATSEEIKKTINLHFEDLKKLLSEQTIESQKHAEEKVGEEYDALEKELAEYKKQQLEKIDQNIYQILLNVSKTVLGKKIDTKENEDVIIKALEDAEKEIN